MQKLVEGVHVFRKAVFGEKRELFEQLAEGQKPEALFITCSDSRINPNLLTQTAPGDIFIMRNAGNIVPPYGTLFGGEAATIEYAVAQLNVEHVVVCGHTHCGAMQGLLQKETLGDMPAVAQWLGYAEATRRIVKENYGHLSAEAQLTAAIEENVLVQMENLQTHPSIAARLAGRRITLHAWVYKIETGEVFAYDREKLQYLPIEKVPVPSQAPRHRPI